MVSRDAFVEEGRPRWTELEALLATASGKRRPGADIGRTAVLYRAACADLMRARSVSLRTGEGDSSISFWWLRCTVQSRSPTWIALP